MLRKLLPTLTLAIALSLLLAGALVFSSTPASQADPYGPMIPTQTNIDIVVSEDGRAIEVIFWTTANSEEKPTGTLAIQIARTTVAGGGAQAAPAVFTKTVRFEGKKVRVVGPVLRPGRYLVSAEFTPDNPDLFLPSENAKFVTIVANDGDGDGDGDDLGGGLPNTGGPDLWLLLLGLGLIGAGSGAVIRARRRGDGGATPAPA